MSSNKIAERKSVTGPQNNKSNYSFNQAKSKITKNYHEHES